MDALAGYGSDSSSSCSSAPVPVAPAAPPAKQPDEEPPQKRKRRWDSQTDNEGSNNSSNSTTSNLPPPSIAATTTGQQKDANGASSLIEWNTDYVSHYKANPTAPSSSSSTTAAAEASRAFLIERLKQNAHVIVQQERTTNGGWAAQLKGQHDFHNPRFLDNAAQQCGIVSKMMVEEGDPNTSNDKQGETFEEYEYRIVQLEEKARIQAFQRDHPA